MNFIVVENKSGKASLSNSRGFVIDNVPGFRAIHLSGPVKVFIPVAQSATAREKMP